MRISWENVVISSAKNWFEAFFFLVYNFVTFKYISMKVNCTKRDLSSFDLSTTYRKVTALFPSRLNMLIVGKIQQTKVK